MARSFNCRLSTEDCRLKNIKYNEISHSRPKKTLNSYNKVYMNRFIYFFLTSILFLASCGIKRSDKLSEKGSCIADLDVIRGKGKIIAVVDYNSTNYFIYRGEPMGYQFDMLKEFATHLGIDLDILVENDLDKSFELLNCGSCDLIALNLTVTQKFLFLKPDRY